MGRRSTPIGLAPTVVLHPLTQLGMAFFGSASPQNGTVDWITVTPEPGTAGLLILSRHGPASPQDTQALRSRFLFKTLPACWWRAGEDSGGEMSLPLSSCLRSNGLCRCRTNAGTQGAGAAGTP